jgi:N-acetylglucosamine-6-phosphate deacetylase
VIDFWLTGGNLIGQHGTARAALGVSGSRIAAVRPAAPAGAKRVAVHGAYVAPGLIDLHVWGRPDAVSQDGARHGTTAFLSALGPEPPAQLAASIHRRIHELDGLHGAACLGLHLEGPFLNPVRGGVLPKRAMRHPSVRELALLAREAAGRVRLITLAPELPGGLAAIRWCARRRIVVSLGHSDAQAAEAARAVRAGARCVTHAFNGMRPLHHRAAGLIDAALTDERLTAMVIADGVHVGRTALRMLLQAKGPQRVALVTDSVRHQRSRWALRKRRGAYYTGTGTLAGSDLTMLTAVRNMVQLAGASLPEAIHMASGVPARVLGEAHRGQLRTGGRADIAVFDSRFRAVLTVVGGRIVFQR